MTTRMDIVYNCNGYTDGGYTFDFTNDAKKLLILNCFFCIEL